MKQTVLILFSLLPLALSVSCNCVAFKVDQIQDYWLSAVQTGVLDVFRTSYDAVSVGIIGGSNYFGSDATLVQYIRNATQTTQWSFEIANNGKTFENFKGATLANQKTWLTAANTNLKNVLSVTPKVFMPPMDTFDQNTLTALAQTNFTVISSASWTDPAPYPLSGQTVYRFPEGTSTSTSSNELVAENNATVLANLRTQLNSYGFAVVGVNPQTYAKKNNVGVLTNVLEPTAINQLKALILGIKAAGIRIVTISSITNNLQSSTTAASSAAAATTRTSAASSAPAPTSAASSAAAATTRTSAASSAPAPTSAASSAPAPTSAASSAAAATTRTSAASSAAAATTRTSAASSAAPTSAASSATRTSAASSAPVASSASNPLSPVVSFRLDDIQDDWITAAQKAIINKFKSENIPLSIGIISNNFGTDVEMVNFVKAQIGASPKIEIVSHGYNHEDFSTFNLNQQKTLLTNSKTQIMAATGVTNVTVFIPPYNAINANTFTALKATGYTLVSSEVDQDPAPYSFSAKNLWRFPIQAATADNDARGYTNSQTLSQIQSQISNYGFSVVMLHPQEFSNVLSNGEYENSVNSTQLAYLTQLLTDVKTLGYRTACLGDLPALIGQQL